MTAPNGSTFDGNPNASPATTAGYRPGLPDFNGGALTDDPQFPPDPATMPTSALLNTDSYQHVSVGKMMVVGRIGVGAGASPTTRWWQVAAITSSWAQTNPFTITRVGAGNYQITWTAGLFPIVGDPEAFLAIIGGSHNYSIQAAYITGSGTQGVQVTTQQDGVPTDLNFHVALY